MNVFKCLLVLLYLLFINCVVAYPKYAEERYCKVHGMNIREGDSVSIPGHCKRVKCIKASTGRISNLDCSLFILTPGCSVTKIDYNKSFPLCCPRSLC